MLNLVSLFVNWTHSLLRRSDWLRSECFKCSVRIMWSEVLTSTLVFNINISTQSTQYFSSVVFKGLKTTFLMKTVLVMRECWRSRWLFHVVTCISRRPHVCQSVVECSSSTAVHCSYIIVNVTEHECSTAVMTCIRSYETRGLRCASLR